MKITWLGHASFRIEIEDGEAQIRDLVSCVDEVMWRALLFLHPRQVPVEHSTEHTSCR